MHLRLYIISQVKRVLDGVQVPISIGTPDSLNKVSQFQNFRVFFTSLRPETH